MASPFELFRKNQKTLMALLLIFAMFAFILMGIFSRESGLNLPVLGLVLGAAIFTLVGVFMGRPIPYATGGALGGLLAGLILVRLGVTANQFALETKIGKLTAAEFQALAHQRNLVNRFIEEAQTTAGVPARMGPIRFAPNAEEDIALGIIFRDLAEKNGIRIDRAAVEEFVDSITTAPPERTEDGKTKESEPSGGLTNEEIGTIVSKLKVTRTQIIKALQSELLSLEGYRQFRPRPIETPQQFWESYRKMNVAESLQVVAVPVSAFADTIADPGDAVLTEFFNKYKTTQSLSPQVPGFYQPRKIQLAYLEASSLEIEPTIPPITDEQVTAFYEANKDTLYLNRTVPDESRSPGSPRDSSVPTLPDFEDLKGTTRPGSTGGPSDAGEQAPLEAPKPDASNEEPTPPANDCVFDEPDAAAPADAAAKNEAGAETDGAGAASTVAPLVAPRPAVPGAGDAPLVAPKPAPKYRPLDEFLRLEIQEQLLRDATRKKQEEVHQQAYAEMQKLSNGYFQAHSKEDAEARQKAVNEFVAGARKTLQAFADKNGLNYGETKLLNQLELSESGEHPVGSSSVGAGEFRGDEPSVADQFFSLPPESLYEPLVSRSRLPSSLYVVWKTADVAEHEPKFGDAGIREQVLAAWRIQEGRPLAKKRAEELEEQLKNVESTWSEYLADLPDDKKTVTGDPEGIILSTRISESFSWIRQQSVPRQMFGMSIPTQQPVLSEISAVKNAGNKFMETVFGEMKDGEVGVVPNADESYFYVVQVRDRHFSGQSSGSGLSEEQVLEAQYKTFLQTEMFTHNPYFPSPYEILADANSAPINNKWFVGLLKDYEVKFNPSARLD